MVLLVYDVERHIQQYFSYIMAEETRSTWPVVVSHWQTLSYILVSSTPRHEQVLNWYSVLNVKAGSMQNVKDFQVKDKNDQYVYTKCYSTIKCK
jgi:hypothetical protein